MTWSLTAHSDHIVTCKACRESMDNGIDKIDADGFSPLLSAAKKCNLLCVRFLIEIAKANVNICGKYNFTPLHWAVKNRDSLLIEYLLAQGASANIPIPFNRFAAKL